MNELLDYAKTITQLLKTAGSLENQDDQRSTELYKIARDYAKELYQQLDEKKLEGNEE
ncbi:hypothetical protein [Saccharolobus caldissimus]|uniref:Uncharacterized protein n=1 Tax=Saccharolobus caldissimus TaxID=1702097 RepID=A0AAQ4CMF9_9CREN|nr:hypothetical protein [Saccharolobus caldissimus]BDB96990.1 hypothetical protein SACC_00070 [Saccharolobus caldissimus]